MLKEGVSVLFLLRPLDILVKGMIWRVVVVLSWIPDPGTWTGVPAVLFVTDVHVCQTKFLGGY